MAAGQPFEYVATVWSFGDRATIPAAQTRHLAAHGGANTTPAANELGVVVLHAGTLRNLTWGCTGSTLTGVKSSIKVYVNGVATGLATSWPGAATSGAAVKGDIAVHPGDTVGLRIQTAAGAGSIARPRASIELDVASEIPWLSNAGGMYYGGAGRIGIGTDSPAETLSVNGTVESSAGGFRFPDGTVQTTAFGGPQTLTPPGSVIAYAGATAPAGWLLCDGTLVDRAAYPELFAAIGTNHGEDSEQTKFALPDYRGMFLRGVTGATNTDPDASVRAAQGPGGNAGNAVGSTQLWEVNPHVHQLGTGSADSFGMVPANDPANTERLASFKADFWNVSGVVHSTQAWPSGPGRGHETRPRNVYVNYLIKT
ncbi:MAG TPA: phage tail protein [Candidatus Limnocylindria bacterium]|jgi:microcystin-dependent protein